MVKVDSGRRGCRKEIMKHLGEGKKGNGSNGLLVSEVKSLSCVQLLATPWTVAYQAPPPMGFPRQEYWSGVPLPSPILHLEDTAINKMDKSPT